MAKHGHWFSALFVALVISSSATATVLPKRITEERYRARLEQVEEDLRDESGSKRYGALQTLLHLAYRYREWPAYVERLVTRATADPDDDVAAKAEKALFHYARTDDSHAPFEPERVRRERHDRQELDSVRAILADPVAPHFGAAQRLVNLASKQHELSIEIRRLLDETRSDPSFDVANLVESFLAARDGRPMDPDLVRPGAAPPRSPSPADYGVADPREALRRTDARFRLDTLRSLKEYVLGTGRRDDPRVLHAFVRSLQDADPCVRSYARFTLQGLSGDAAALRQVYRREYRP